MQAHTELPKGFKIIETSGHFVLMLWITRWKRLAECSTHQAAIDTAWRIYERMKVLEAK